MHTLGLHVLQCVVHRIASVMWLQHNTGREGLLRIRGDCVGREEGLSLGSPEATMELDYLVWQSLPLVPQ